MLWGMIRELIFHCSAPAWPVISLHLYNNNYAALEYCHNPIIERRLRTCRYTKVIGMT